MAAGFGLIFGSFFNVCIYRIPLEMTLGNRSVCPRCGAQIKWYDNIPLLSFIVLGGKCRNCKEPISWRYPMVEVLSAVIFVTAYWWSINVVPGAIGIEGGPFVPELFIGLLLGSILLIISFVDIDYGIIPNLVVFPGIVLMFALVVGLAVYRGEPIRIASAAATGIGTSVVLFCISYVYGLIRLKGREDIAGSDEGDEENIGTPMGMGFGDFKLVLIIGFALGYFNWFFIFFTVIAACLLALLIAIIYHISMQKKIPFGPFLAVGSMLALYFGPYLYNLLISH